MERNDLKHLYTGEPTYWPSDRNKLPDLVDFCVIKDVPEDFAVAKSCFYLSSGLDHTKSTSLRNIYTHGVDFRQLINERSALNVFHNIAEEPEAAAKFFDDTLGGSERNATHTTAYINYRKTPSRLAPISNTRNQRA
jgi:hypothetical protein